MSLTNDILGSYGAPRAAIGRVLAADRREGRALFYLMLACALTFVAQLPRVMRQANEDLPFQGLMAGTLFATIFVAPLLFYAIATVIALALRVLRGPVDAFGVRVAVFWALLASAPLVLAHAAFVTVTGLPGTLFGLLVLGMFLRFAWIGISLALAGAAVRG
jgi:predicted membrane protein